MPSPPDTASRPEAAANRRPAASRRGTLLRWVARPALAVSLLALAVAVSVMEGQPSTTERPSGVSVSVPVSPYTGSVGTLLVVAGGDLLRFDTLDRRMSPIPLPRGLTALRAWTQNGHDVVLGRLPSGRTAAYLLTPGRPPTALGPAEVMVPSADGDAVWLVTRRTATRVPLAARGLRRTVPLPRASRLVGESQWGLIVSTGTVPDPLLPGRRPAPTLTPARTAGMPTPTLPPSGVGALGSAGHGSAAGTTASPATSPTVAPTTPVYATASPVPSTGPEAVPLTTLVVGWDGSVRFVAAAEAVATTREVVLVRDAERRLGVVSPRPGVRLPRWLPKLSAVAVTGPGALSADGRTFAVLARVNDYARLMVGPTTAKSEAAIRVVALDGGPPQPGSAPPAFTASGRVLAARPDGRVVYYTPGERTGWLLGDDLPPASAVSQA
ncbi:MAG TPA: hypothetical protein VEL73_06555 [Mycobacteriales bacterium]|nr:hypothetical protein [Mycobacteriales bacterium]